MAKEGLGEMTDQQYKADAGKAQPDLLEMGFARALRLVQATLEYGALKYEAHSWRGVPGGKERYKAALIRHLLAHSQGEKLDPESGLPHLAHALCNAAFIYELDEV